MAFPFRLRVTLDRGSVVAPPDAAPFQEQYESGAAEWDEQDTYVILRPRQTNGYIRLLSDGKYILRYYTPQQTVMSLGRCE